jgi:TonB family protein
MKITAAFGNVPLKRRLKMMTKNKQRGMLLRYGAASVMMVCCFLLLPAVNLTENASTPEWENVQAAVTTENAQAAAASEMQEKEVPPYKAAPQYPGGETALMTYLASAVKYPEEARKKGTTGTVYVSFVVSKKGEVKNARVIRGVGDGCDEAALTAVQGMQRWTPGLNQQDQAIEVEITLPVKFELSGKKAKE